MPNLFDHSLAALLLLVYPILTAIWGRDSLRELIDEPAKRPRTYWRTMAVQWGQFLLIIGLWVGLDRPWSDLGIRFEFGAGFLTALVLALTIAWLLWSQLRRIGRDPSRDAELREQVRAIEPLVPKSPGEVRACQVLSVSAGICEEIAYRGFILWYLSTWMHLSLAIALMAIAFGASHLYQGVKPAAQILVLGVVAALFYLMSGSIWIPILLHILLDLNQLAMARAVVLSDPNPGEESPADAAMPG